MKPKSLILMSVAIGCGLIAAITAQKMMKTNDVEVKLWVANDTVRQGKVVDKDWFFKHFREVSVPKSQLDSPDLPYGRDRGMINHLTSSAEDQKWLDEKVWGKYIVNQTITENSVLSKDYLIDRSQGGLAAIIHPGHTAFAINVDASTAVAGWLIPTVSWVEVLNVRRTAGAEKFAKVIMRNIRVLAVDQDSGATQAASEGGAVAKVPTTVTLEVNKEEAKTLRQALEENGRVTLNLIGAKDLELISEDDRYLPQNRKGDVVSDRPKKATIDDLVRQGFVTYTIQLNANTSSGLILPENRVKIFGIRKLPGSDARESYLVMKNIRVLAVDDLTGIDREGERAISGRTLTLELTETEVKRMDEAIEAASQVGRPLSVAVIPNREIRNKTEKELDSPEARAGDAPPREQPKPAPQAYDPKQPRMAIFISSSGNKLLQADEQGHLHESAGGYAPPASQGPPQQQAAPTPPPAPAPIPAASPPPGSITITPVK